MLGTLGLIFEPRKWEIKDMEKDIVKNIWFQIPEYLFPNSKYSTTAQPEGRKLKWQAYLNAMSFNF